MKEQFSRTELLLGDTGINKLAGKRVAVFGIGGVGSFTAEALVRCGIGKIDLIDDDKVCESNINRQLIALHSTIGKYKTDVAAERFLDINPDIKIRTHKCFYLPETSNLFDFTEYDYIVDAIDTVSGKIELIKKAKASSTPIICALGAGNKLNPTAFRVADIYKTRVCPLARVLRRELKKAGIDSLKVVYSEEEPQTPLIPAKEMESASAHKRRSTPGSLPFVPSVSGLIIAGEVVFDLLNAD